MTNIIMALKVNCGYYITIRNVNCTKRYCDLSYCMAVEVRGNKAMAVENGE
jgi:hypothetical protein